MEAIDYIFLTQTAAMFTLFFVSIYAAIKIKRCYIRAGLIALSFGIILPLFTQMGHYLNITINSSQVIYHIGMTIIIWVAIYIIATLEKIWTTIS